MTKSLIIHFIRLFYILVCTFVPVKKSTLLFGLLSIILIGLSIDVEAQCAMCKAVLESNMDSGEKAVGKGINGGIIYIMFVPYLLLAVAGFFTYRHYKKTNKA